MELRKLSDEEVSKLGLDDAPAAPSLRKLSDDEVSKLGLEETSNEPSALEAGLRGAAQGATFGFGDEAQGVIQALGDILRGDNGNFMDHYRHERDAARRENAKAADAHGGAYIAGNLIGGAATAPLMPGGTLARAAGQGAAMGFGGSDADVTRGDVGGAAKDTVLGGALGSALHMAPAVVAKVSPWLAQKAENFAVNQGRRAVTGGANSLSGKKGPSYAAIQRMLEEGGIKAGDTTANIAARTGGLRQEAGDALSGIRQDLTDQGVRVRPEDVNELVDELKAAGNLKEQNTLNSSLPGRYHGAAEDLAAKGKEGLDLNQLKSIKGGLQEEANYGGYENTPSNRVKEDIAGRVGGLENDVVRSQAGKDQADAFLKAKDRYGDYKEVNKAALKGADQAEKRNLVSVRDIGVAGAAAIANPHLAIPAAIANYLIRTRGSSTAAVASHGISKVLGKAGSLAATNPAALGRFGVPLSRALQRGGQQAFAAAHFVLSQTDPEYNKMVDNAPEAPKVGEGGGE